MNIRGATIADALFIFELAETTLTQYVGSGGKHCLAALQRCNTTLICEDDANSKERLGFILIEWIGREPLMYAIATQPAAQRRGAGRLLLESCFSWVSERSKRTTTPLTAYIAESNRGALAWARAVGFNISFGARHLQYKATGIWAIPMTKIIAVQNVADGFSPASDFISKR